VDEQQATDTGRKSYVYAIGSAEQHLVKIGVSSDPQKRLKFIQTTCPFDVSILWTTEGTSGLEDALHRHFAKRHIRGEWFEFPDGDAAGVIAAAAAEIARRAAEMPASYTAGVAKVPEDIAKALGVPAGTYALREQRVIFEDGEPVEVLVSWVRKGRSVGCDIAVLGDGELVLEDSDKWTAFAAAIPGTGRPYRRTR
jgi:Meiotically up-regulated gene 113